ncbi:MAG TPA: pyruvate kinase [Thermomicrobiales bacterium]|nr:pyruvate kinase [Thermomicrobiales bacterium]
MERRVKIVATLGPAVSEPVRLRALMEAGADVVRVNAAHGSPEERAELIRNVREAAAAVGKRVPILFDLRGLKIRTGPLPDGENAVEIMRGEQMRLEPGPVETSRERLGINYPELLNVISSGSRVLVSDGLIELHVDSVAEDHAIATVVRDGQLRGRQGVTLPGAPIKGGALTEVDREDIAFAVEHGVDFLGLSFLNDASDLHLARKIARQHGDVIPGLISKIERPQALENIEEITAASDGVMVARGDLGVQLPPERVPRAQKHIIGVANRMGVPVITATQMLESMIQHPVATRAETSDVANAVWDGTDAVMLSAETAVGKYPIEAVRTMHRIICEVEKEGPVRSQAAQEKAVAADDPESQFADAIARAAFALSDQTPVQHLVVFTKTGTAAHRIAKYRPFPPIIAVADSELVARRLSLVWGVDTVVSSVEPDQDATFRRAGREIIDQGLAEEGEYALIVGSLPMSHLAGRTNLVHFRKLGT